MGDGARCDSVYAINVPKARLPRRILAINHARGQHVCHANRAINIPSLIRSTELMRQPEVTLRSIRSNVALIATDDGNPIF